MIAQSYLSSIVRESDLYSLCFCYFTFELNFDFFIKVVALEVYFICRQFHLNQRYEIPYKIKILHKDKIEFVPTRNY